jgi:predicted Zn-dependent protease
MGPWLALRVCESGLLGTAKPGPSARRAREVWALTWCRPAWFSGSNRQLRRRVLTSVALAAVIALALGTVCFCCWVQHQFPASKQALDAFRPDLAKRHVTVCLKYCPNHPATQLLAARAARQATDLEQAERRLDEYQKLGGDPADEEFILERALLRAQQGDVDTVLKYCQTLVEQKHPASPRILDALVQGYLQTYRTADAEITVRIWLDRMPAHPQALCLGGWVKEQRDFPERAITDYQQALELVPGRDDIRFRLANCLLECSRPGEALALLEDLCRRRPDHLLGLVMRGRALYAVGREAEAAAALDELLAEHPSYPIALIERGRLALQAGQAAAAEKHLRQGLRVRPSDAQAWYLLYQALVQQGRQAQAADMLDRFNRLRSDQNRVREIATKEMSQRPNDPALHQELGATLLRGGQAAEGLRWLKSALRKDPHYRPAHEALADYYEKVGLIGLASRHRQQAQAASPADANGFSAPP